MLLHYLSSLTPLTEKETALIDSLFVERTFRKRETLWQEGDPCKYFYFVEEGCLKLYKVDYKGGEHIFQFATENHWLTDMRSFQEKTPSLLTAEALEETSTRAITLENLNRLYGEIPALNLVFRKLSERNQQVLQDRILELLSGSAQDCYVSFSKHYPQLIHRLPQTQIAAFLGITPEFFSKMKAQLLRQ